MIHDLGIVWSDVFTLDRLCIDYRNVNNITKLTVSPLDYVQIYD